MKEQISISVLMCVYNAEEYVAQAIRSVLAQTFTQFELIIVNDGSTDGTKSEILRFNDPRIIYLEQEHGGIAAALNHGLEYARAELVARFDADDICLPHRLANQYEFMVRNPEYVVTGCAADYIDQDGEHVFSYIPEAITDEDIRRIKADLCPFIHSGVMFRRDAILEAGGYNSLAHAFEDHFLWLKVLENGKGRNIPSPMLKVRLNPQSLTIDERWRTREFLRIRNRVLERQQITREEGDRLYEIIKKQNNRRVKQGAYYSLLAKKYLWNNYQPAKARSNLRKVLSEHPGDISSYLLWVLSYLPESAVKKIYSLTR